MRRLEWWCRSDQGSRRARRGLQRYARPASRRRVAAGSARRTGGARVARRRQQVTFGSLTGIGGLLGSAYGYIGTSVYFVLGGIALYALGVTPLLILDRRRGVPPHGVVVRRGVGGDAGGQRRGELRAARLRSAHRLRRRLGHPARLHHPGGHRLQVRALLPRRDLAATAGAALRPPRRRRRCCALLVALNLLGPARITAADLPDGRPRPGHAACCSSCSASSYSSAPARPGVRSTSGRPPPGAACCSPSPLAAAAFTGLDADLEPRGERPASRHATSP